MKKKKNCESNQQQKKEHIKKDKVPWDISNWSMRINRASRFARSDCCSLVKSPFRKCVLLCIFSCYENNFSSKGKITEVTRSESFALKHNRGSRTPKGSDHHFQMHSSCLCQSKCSFVSSTRKSTLVLLVLENSIDIKLGPVAVIVGNVTIKAGCHR